MKLAKIFWFLRAIIYKIILGHVGKKCIIGKPIFIFNEKKIFLSDHVRIFPGSRLEAHNNGSILISNNVSIGQNLHLISSGECLNIKENTIISANVFISNCEHDFDNPNILKEKHTEIGENCFIGYGAVILPGAIIGNNCIIGANAVVKGSFPNDSIIAGIPAKLIRNKNVRKTK